jgi:hypothetical protein
MHVHIEHYQAAHLAIEEYLPCGLIMALLTAGSTREG